MNTKASANKPERTQAVERGITIITSTVGKMVNLPFYQAAPTEKKVRFKQLAVAFALGGSFLDITLDHQGSIFFNTAVTPILDEVLQEYNEVTIIDIKYIRKITYPIWLTRYRVAIGETPVWMYSDTMYDVLSRPEADIMVEFLSGMRG